MDIPNWYSLILLFAAAWRTFQLIGHDDILDVPRRKILRLGRDWQKEGDPVPDNYRVKWGVFITCPYCAGFWIAVAWWLAWLIWPHATTLIAVPWAISATLAFFAKTDEKLNSS